MIRDLRFFFRSLRRSPGHAATIILTLAIGIGATTAILGVVDYVLLRHLPFADAGRLVMVLEGDSRGGFRLPSNPTTNDWARDPGTKQAFEGITYIRGNGASVCATADHCETKGVAYVKADFFPILKPKLAMGRLLLPDDQQASTPVVVISNRLWRSQLGSDPQVVGRRILIDSVPNVVVGVLAPGAVYPPFADAWQPVTAYRFADVLDRRGSHVDSRTLARLRPGVDSARAASLMSVVTAGLAAQFPADQKGWKPAPQSVQQELLGNVQPMLLTFTAAAIAILILVCANVAGLLITRGLSRRRELAIRVAIGASPSRVMRQVLIEAAGYAVIGGSLGAVLAAAGVVIAKRSLAGQLPSILEMPLDGYLLAIAFAATAVSVVLCGAIPALWVRRRSLSEVLAAVGGGAVSARGTSRSRQVLVGLQFAVAVTLLVGTGLLGRSFLRAAGVDIGFDARNLYTIRIAPPGRPEPAAAAALYDRLIRAVGTVRGVHGVAFINHAPFGGASIPTTLVVDGQLGKDSSSQLFYRTVSSSYLGTMRMHMQSGRWFTEEDERTASPVFVINETTAKRFWPGQSPIGARVRVSRASQASRQLGQFVPGTVVGVVRDIHQISQDVLPVAEVYVPYTLEPWGWGSLVVRADRSALPAMREAVRSVDTRLVAESDREPFSPVENAIESGLQPRVVAIRFVAAFAATGLLLACLGLYGVIAYNVGQRGREIALRKAMGATDGGVVRLLARDSAAMVAGGTIAGGVGAWASTRWIRPLLFHTTANDPAVYALAILALVIMALIATLLPARRANAIDPATVLRGE